jgi:hypothetical protein
MAPPKEVQDRIDDLVDQGWMPPLHLHEVGDPCDERCVPYPPE